jgi:hypothetical protein
MRLASGASPLMPQVTAMQLAGAFMNKKLEPIERVAQYITLHSEACLILLFLKEKVFVID